ncbi:MAG TPA: prolyl oligopeptidase family serine peptidase [Candidatus Limnocylindria bacterium]|nr:prolyl oligopeptidase family serine peptidase [Candidatus Limnocylindria bacterium]
MIRVPPAPKTPRDVVVDEHFGERVADPYRWLEKSDERVSAWTDAQNARTREVLDRIPERARYAARLRELLAVGLLGTPWPAGGRIFHKRREGDQRQAVLYVRDGVDGRDRALVDPNLVDPSGLTTIDWYYPSRDGALVAYGLSRGGTEMSTLYVRDVASGRDLDVRIPHTQRTAVAWTGDGFYYVVHPAPGTVPPGEEHYHRRVRFHALDEGPAHEDAEVFGAQRPKEDIVGVSTSPDGRYVVFSAYEGWRRNDLYLLDRERPERGLVTVIEGKDALSGAHPAADGIFIRTNLDAPNYRVAFAPYDRPADWRTVVAETDRPIEELAVTRAHLVVHRLDRAVSRLEVFARSGAREREIALPEAGAVSPSAATEVGIRGDASGDLACFVFQSFATAPAAFGVDPRDGTPRPVVALRGAAVRADVVVHQVSYRSKDGTEVPMFLVRRRDVRPTGDVPTVLTGYGGFNVSCLPLYTAAAILWAEEGGLYALANLRGGGELGERWHRAGMLANKQNVFDDLHAAAEHLVSAGWTRRERLGAYGGSNGGLLMGAALTQRPDLYGALVCLVPLLDMLRYQHLLIARFWIAEYGSSEDPEQYRWLRAYSPYHNVKEGVRYPPILLTTAEGDSRVDPMHARKMAALLQRVAPDGVTLLRVDRDAGHGVGKPLDMQVDDAADQWAFLAWRLRGTFEQ